MYPQIHKGDPRTCAIFITAWGSNWGSSGFSRIRNNRGSSGAYVTCIFCSSIEDKQASNAAGHTKIVDAFVHACFANVVDKNSKTPNLSPVADDAITWGDIQGLGSPLYICECIRETGLCYLGM